MKGVSYLFTGSRNWSDRFIVDLIVTGLWAYSKQVREPVFIVHGAARGLDTEAGLCAERIGLETHDYPAVESTGHPWPRAGVLRNQMMLDESNPKVVFAFNDDLRNSRGTNDMCRRALKAGKMVYLISHVTEEDLK